MQLPSREVAASELVINIDIVQRPAKSAIQALHPTALLVMLKQMKCAWM
jgi:hypothetical protein